MCRMRRDCILTDPLRNGCRGIRTCPAPPRYGSNAKERTPRPRLVDIEEHSSSFARLAIGATCFSRLHRLPDWASRRPRAYQTKHCRQLERRSPRAGHVAQDDRVSQRARHTEVLIPAATAPPQMAQLAEEGKTQLEQIRVSLKHFRATEAFQSGPGAGD